MAPNAPTPGNAQLQLRDVVVTLQRQNSMLSDVVQNTQGTENQLNAFIAYLQRRDQQDHLEETERAAEARKQATRDLTSNAGPGRASTSKAGGLFGGGNWLKTGAVAGAVAGMGPMLLGAALRSIPFAIAVAFGDEIEKFFGGEEFGEMVANSAIGGLFGMIFGKKMAMLGTVLGALYTPERAASIEKSLGTIGTNIKEGSIKALALLGIGVPSILAIANTIGDGSVKGLRGLADLSSGDFEEFKKNWVEASVVLGVFAAIFARGWIANALRLLGSKKALMLSIASLLGIKTSSMADATVTDMTGGANGGDGGYRDPGETAGMPATVTEAASQVAAKATVADVGAAAIGGQAGVSSARKRIAAERSTPVTDVKKGDPVRSSSGNLMKAGPDGKATATPYKDGWWKKAISGTRWGDVVKGMLKSGARVFPAVTAVLLALDSVKIYDIYYSDKSQNQKIKEMGTILGKSLTVGVLAAFGGIVGAAAGGGTPWSIVTGLIGAGAGASVGVLAKDKISEMIIALMFFGVGFKPWTNDNIKDVKERLGSSTEAQAAQAAQVRNWATGAFNTAAADPLGSTSMSSASVARGGKAPSISGIGNGYIPNQMAMAAGGRGGGSPSINVDASQNQVASSQYTMSVESPVNDPHDMRRNAGLAVV